MLFRSVRQYLLRGSDVIAACRIPSSAVALEALKPAHQNLSIYRLEVSDEASVAALAKALDGRSLDILINNAGIKGGDEQNLHGMNYAAWAETLAVNTIAPFRVTTALLRNLKLSKRPRVITLSSQMGALQRESSGWYAYRSSKAAVNKVMQGLACDLRQFGIIVCPVHPGWVRTDMGGSSADISVEESASGLIALLDRLTLKDSGRFYQWNGTVHPW